MEERRKRRHQDDAEGGYDDEKGKRRRTLSSNSQRSDKLDGHSTGETSFSCRSIQSGTTPYAVFSDVLNDLKKYVLSSVDGQSL